MALTQVKTLGIADDAVTTDKMQHATDGTVITYDANQVPVHVGPGSDGQVLTSTGAGSPPAFETLPTSGIADVVSDTSPQLGGDLDTNSFEIKLDDSHSINFGDGDGSNGADLKIYHDGTNNHIKGLNGSTYVGAVANVEIRNTDAAGSNAEWMGRFIADGAVELYYDNGKKFETNSTGVTVNGTAVPNADNTRDLGSAALQWKDVHIGNDLYLADDAEIRLGENEDFKLWHNGTDSYIQNYTGNLYIRGDGDDIFLKAVNTEDSLICRPNAAVEIFYDNSKKFETTSAGAAITGRQTISAQPAFRASLTSNVSATNTIVFNSQQYEQGGDNYDPTTGIYTCPVAGLYMFIAACTSTNASGGKQITMYKNSDAIGRVFAGNNTNDHQPLPLTVVQTFSANDTCKVDCTAGAVYGNTGGDSQHSQFMGYFLG